jgi:hypothetical protein
MLGKCLLHSDRIPLKSPFQTGKCLQHMSCKLKRQSLSYTYQQYSLRTLQIRFDLGIDQLCSENTKPPIFLKISRKGTTSIPSAAMRRNIQALFRMDSSRILKSQLSCCNGPEGKEYTQLK